MGCSVTCDICSSPAGTTRSYITRNGTVLDINLCEHCKYISEATDPNLENLHDIVVRDLVLLQIERTKQFDGNRWRILSVSTEMGTFISSMSDRLILQRQTDTLRYEREVIIPSGDMEEGIRTLRNANPDMTYDQAFAQVTDLEAQRLGNLPVEQIEWEKISSTARRFR